MKKILCFLVNVIGAEMGSLATFKATLAKLPACPTPITRDRSVRFADLVEWHEWGSARCNSHGEEPGTVHGWKRSRYGYESTSLSLLADFALTSRVDSWRCDIQDVHGLSASKSNLSNFNSLDDLVETNSREMIPSIDRIWLDKNLAHHEIRILQGPSGGDFFSRCQWDGRLYLRNSGGSHHFSAARYIAKRIGVKIPLEGQLYEHSLNPVVVQDLITRFEILAIPEDWSHDHDFHKLLRLSGASYYWKALPRPWNTFRSIFLPKNKPRVLRIATLLREKNALDVGASLSVLLRQQLSFQQQHDTCSHQSLIPGQGKVKPKI
ncbi:hypothetical protein G3N58_09005 [Paraburkholderia sp. Ac-20342]|uniref:DUF6685 family protein n=1 Tax=Paraburkholderia sp. Ac-20342 TaxID=2703889 RepID=UPI00198143AA|nr:DUF6685 family protein [Paraburkholderia sp. Ac-20342]MBN3846965.1 hypothetical protein [Paraburkholderia sp. Ac-20342]